MSLKTFNKYAFASITTFDNETFFLTEKEFEAFKQILQHPDVKMLQFDDGGIAVSDIRRYEIIRKALRAPEYEIIDELPN